MTAKATIESKQNQIKEGDGYQKRMEDVSCTRVNGTMLYVQWSGTKQYGTDR